MPPEFRARLRDVLEARGYGDILGVTEELNGWLEEDDCELVISKSSVGRYAKALKDQREAFAVAEAMMQNMDLEEEGRVQAGLYHMISSTAMNAIMHVREGDKHLSADESAKYARMMKDLMASSGLREKMLEDERKRVAREAREAAQAEMDEALEATAKEAGLDGQMLDRLRRGVLGLRA